MLCGRGEDQPRRGNGRGHLFGSCARLASVRFGHAFFEHQLGRRELSRGCQCRAHKLHARRDGRSRPRRIVAPSCAEARKVGPRSPAFLVGGRRLCSGRSSPRARRSISEMCGGRHRRNAIANTAPHAAAPGRGEGVARIDTRHRAASCLSCAAARSIREGPGPRRSCAGLGAGRGRKPPTMLLSRPCAMARPRPHGARPRRGRPGRARCLSVM